VAEPVEEQTVVHDGGQGGRLMRVVVAELGVKLGFEVVVEGEL
jgi:hypothetical protein